MAPAAAAIGTAVAWIPDGAKALTVDGKTYYESDGVYYQPFSNGSNVIYMVVVNPLSGPHAGSPADAPALLAEIVREEHESLGDAVLAAQEAYAETGVMPELLAIDHLFGDPGLKIR